eukprot:6790906-Alexandrium_andersonii.AAC.1
MVTSTCHRGARRRPRPGPPGRPSGSRGCCRGAPLPLCRWPTRRRAWPRHPCRLGGREANA